MFNEFLKMIDNKKHLKVTVVLLDKQDEEPIVNYFPYETNTIFNVRNTDINFALTTKDEKGSVNFFVNKNFGLDLSVEYASPLRTHYPDLMPEPFKIVYRLEEPIITIKLLPDIKMTIEVEKVERVKVIKQDKIRGCLIGGAIGDALGYQIEFQRGIRDKQVTGFLNGHGVISDDTQMTLFTANGLLFAATRNALKLIRMNPIDAIYEAYLDWLDTQNNRHDHKGMCWIKYIPDLRIARAPGNTCIDSLCSKNRGTLDEPINNSKGCGGIMRVAPVGLYLNDPIEAGLLGAEASALTHGHPLGIIPSYFLATLISILTYEDIDLSDAVKKTIDQYENNFDIYGSQNKKYFMDLINKAIKLSKEHMVDIEAIRELGEGWVAEETLAIALYSCLKYSNSYKDAIVCAINHDGDSDSTGAVAGNIMGAYLGINAIPKEYKDRIELYDLIIEIADDLSIEVPVKQNDDNNDKDWINKYFYCRKDYIK